MRGCPQNGVNFGRRRALRRAQLGQLPEIPHTQRHATLPCVLEDAARIGRDMPGITVVGTVTFDLIGTFTGTFPEDSRTVMLDALASNHGGRGANCAVLARAMGGDVELVSCVGADFAGSEYEAELSGLGVATAGILYSAEASTTRVVLADNGRDSRVYVHQRRGPNYEEAFGRWVADTVRRSRPAILYCTSEIPRANLAALSSAASSVSVYAPGHDVVLYSATMLVDCVGRCDILVVNTTEARILESILGCPIASVHEEYGLRAVIVTCGTDGSECHLEESPFHVSACQATSVVDTSGAGDAFAAGLIDGLLRGWDLRASMRFGASLASFIVESVGCRTVVPSRAAVLDRMQRRYSEV